MRAYLERVLRVDDRAIRVSAEVLVQLGARAGGTVRDHGLDAVEFGLIRSAE